MFVYSTVRTPFGLRSLAAVPLVRVSRNLRELLYLAALIDRDRWGAQRHDNTRTLDLFVRKVDALDALAARGCRAVNDMSMRASARPDLAGIALAAAEATTCEARHSVAAP